MKSGLYITEIVKRLYRSEEMRRRFPDDNQRLEHKWTNCPLTTQATPKPSYPQGSPL